MSAEHFRESVLRRDGGGTDFSVTKGKSCVRSERRKRGALRRLEKTNIIKNTYRRVPKLTIRAINFPRNNMIGFFAERLRIFDALTKPCIRPAKK